MNFTNFPTPFFTFDRRRFERNVERWREALAVRFGRSVVSYSVKTNSAECVLRAALQCGCRAEVVSHDEYMLARQIGFAPDRIVYNGPLKQRESFIEAIMAGAVVNVECKRELDWLCALPHDRKYNVGLRVNIDLNTVAPGDVRSGDSYSRFGLSWESGELAEAVGRIAAIPHVRLAGLHLHRTSRSRSVGFYRRLARYAAAVVRDLQLQPDYIDIGGGFDFTQPGTPTCDEYVAAIADDLAAGGISPDCSLIIEPGTALVANTMRYVTEVIDVKRLSDTLTVVTVDGSRNDVDPLFKRNNHDKRILYAGSTAADRPTLPLQVVCGATCMEFDKLFELSDSPRLQSGDRITLRNVGAYTLTLRGRFIDFEVPVIDN